MKAFAQPKVNGAQRSWFGAVFAASLESLPYKVRELLADRDARERLERMDPGAAFVELRTVLGQMEHLAKEVLFETERARELFDSIDALAALPGPDAGLELEPTGAATGKGGFLAAFLEVERMALAFERRHHREEVARFRAELHAGPPVPAAAESAPPRAVARPRERRDATPRRSTSRAGPDDDPGPEPFPLSPVDRWPLLWRCRAARCTWHEWREGWPE